MLYEKKSKTAFLYEFTYQHCFLKYGCDNKHDARVMLNWIFHEHRRYVIVFLEGESIVKHFMRGGVVPMDRES